MSQIPAQIFLGVDAHHCRKISLPPDRGAGGAGDSPNERSFAARRSFQCAGSAHGRRNFPDLFAGSGSCGHQALSRGADHVMFMERAPVALKVLQANLARLGLTAGSAVHTGSVGAYVRRARTESKQFDLVFLDPPYDAAHDMRRRLLTAARRQTFFSDRCGRDCRASPQGASGGPLWSLCSHTAASNKGMRPLSFLQHSGAWLGARDKMNPVIARLTSDVREPERRQMKNRFVDSAGMAVVHFHAPPRRMRSLG